MAGKLHVENLSHSIDSEDLDRLFAPYGTVHLAEVMVDPRTGQSTGVALVEMESDAEAEAAIVALNGVRCCGRVLAVGWSTAGEETAAGHPRMFMPMNTSPETAPEHPGPH